MPAIAVREITREIDIDTEIEFEALAVAMIATPGLTVGEATNLYEIGWLATPVTSMQALADRHELLWSEDECRSLARLRHSDAVVYWPGMIDSRSSPLEEWYGFGMGLLLLLGVGATAGALIALGKAALIWAGVLH